jgi:hypothetical protein
MNHGEHWGHGEARILETAFIGKQVQGLLRRFPRVSPRLPWLNFLGASEEQT